MRPLIPTFMSEELYVAATEHRPPKGTPRASWFSPGGFQAFEHFWGVPAAIDLHTSIGWQRIAERIRELNGAAKEGLAKMPHVKLRTPMSSALSAGIICFEIDGMQPYEVVRRLHEKKIIASASPYKIAYSRLSYGIANSEADVERSLKAVYALRGWRCP
jgi:selenocysteine lyase/cysteine desulfurase